MPVDSTNVLAAAVAALDDRITWSVRVDDLATGVTLAARDAGRAQSGASLGKLVLLVAASQAIERDAAIADEPLDRGTVAPVADSGVWQHLAQQTLSFADAALLTGAASDNLATNVLLDRLGLNRVHALAAELGIDGIALHDAVRDARGPDDPVQLSTVSADGAIAVLARLSRGALLGGTGDARVLDWLAPALDLSMVAGAFGLDPLAHIGSAPRVWCKTGTDDGVRGDCGIVHGAGPSLAYAVIANWDAAGPGQIDTRDRVHADMQRLGRALRTVLGD